MASTASVARVLVASPSETTEERRAVRDTVWRWTTLNAEEAGLVLIPILWSSTLDMKSADIPRNY